MPFPDLNSLFKQLDLNPLETGLQLVSAQELAADSFPRLDTDRPALVLQLAAADAPAVQRTLAVNYPSEHRVTLAGEGENVSLALEQLGEAKIPAASALYIPPLEHASSPLTLANIMARLRAPVIGCPWDLEQTHASITRALIEETYEVIETIEEGDTAHLQEELGDLWLHVLFQTQIARDQGEFKLSDVGAELAAKLIRRHPHIFGNVEAADAGAVIANWERIKRAEKKGKGQEVEHERLDSGIPRHLPALTRAQKVSERAHRRAATASAGNGHLFEPQADSAAFQVIRELDALPEEARARALGDLLLELAARAERDGIDAEGALQAAVTRLAQEKAES